MKTDVVAVTETRKNLLVEIPSTAVEEAVARAAQAFGRRAKVPGFRPGKAPARVVRQRYRDQILHDVAHELIPRAVDDALRERGLEPVEVPDIKDVVLEEGQPLTFTATFDTMPEVDPGDYGSFVVRKPAVAIEASAVDAALEDLRQRAARFEAVEGRPAQAGDTLAVDLRRQRRGGEDQEPESHTDVSVELGNEMNPPGFDEHLVGADAGETRSFTITYPADSSVEGMAGAEVDYTVTVKAIRLRLVPALDDELAKDLEFENLGALRERVTADLQREAERQAERNARTDLLRQVSSRVTGEVPESLVEKEMDRRLEELVRGLVGQGLDLQQVNLDWKAMRERQREAADQTVRGALVLDEIARREGLVVTDDELQADIDQMAARMGQSGASLRARLEKERALGGLAAGIRREKTIAFLMSRARIEVA
jgi:trigger factor